MVRRTAVLAIFAAVAFASGADARDPVENAPHLRPATRSDQAIVAESLRRSPTVRDLVATLEQSNVVAFVTFAEGTPVGPASSIQFVGRSAKQRFLLIKVRREASLDRSIPKVAHELQHAVEVSRSGWVVDGTGFQRMISVIGWADPSAAPRFETTAACAAARRAEKELRVTAPAQLPD
jgi:hypothetical protein